MRVIGTKLFPLLGIALLAAGCASTSSYQDSITTFAAASDQAATAFQTLDNDATAQLNDLRFQQALKDKLVQKSGCAEDSDHCTLTLTGGDPVYISDLMPNTAALLDGIRDYGIALDALEKADASKDVEAATSKAISSAATVSSAINAIAGSALTAVAEPVGAIAGYGYGLFQERRKQAAIVRAVMIMDDIIQRGKAEMAVKLKLVQAANLDKFQKAVSAAHKDFVSAATPEALTNAVNAAKAMDAVIKAGIPDLYDKLAAAHAKLKETVTNPKTDPAAAFQAVSAFLAQAQHIKAVADAIAATGKQPM